MLSINLCKKHINVNGKHYSEKEIELLRDSLNQTAEILVEKYLQDKNQSKTHQIKTFSSIPISHVENINHIM